MRRLAPVRAKRPEEDRLLWESPLERAGSFYPILDILPAGKGYPATIAAGTTTGVLGMAGPTGKSRWRCETGGITDHSSLLATGDPQGLPRIWTGSGNMQTCFEALAVDDRGRCLLPQPAPLQYDSAFVNRRLLRPLPWNRPADTQFFHEDWSGWWIVVAIDVIAIASIVGRWPGKSASRGLVVRPVACSVAACRNRALRICRPRNGTRGAFRLERLVRRFHPRGRRIRAASAANRGRLVARAAGEVEREVDSC